MQLPSTCDVLVIGAGPAGTAAAHLLARSGLDVVVADQRVFPRDKVCGDGLISDALGALEQLGVRDRVLADAAHAQELRLYAPGGHHIALRGRFACVPRERLDALLVESARDAGATIVQGATATAPLVDGGRVAGARVQVNGAPVDVRARQTLLATGANTAALHSFGLDVPAKPSGVAGRAYFEAPPDVARRFTHLTIAYVQDWCPGYGWIFPSPGNRFNIGVGLFPGDGAAAPLRDFWAAFQQRFAPAAEIIAASRQLAPFRGAPLRTGLMAAQFGRPGMLVVGEAAAVTYSATGEGIGKAMESGLLAARFVADALKNGGAADALSSAYAGEFRRLFSPRYNAYRVAQSWASSPFMLNLLSRRAAGGRFVREELEALIDERGDASQLFSARGLLTALIR